DPICDAWTIKQEKPEVLEGLPLDTWTNWTASIGSVLQTFRRARLVKLVGGLIALILGGACLIVFIASFMTLTEEATWVSIVALGIAVLTCAIAPATFLILTCVEESAKAKLDEL
ncbi:panB, partial [Symbiodinium pilosum]